MTTDGLKKAQETAIRIIANVERVIVGKHDLVQLGVMALLCKGHILIEGVPGVGKTMFARSVAKSIGCSFKRIQCTSDLLPSDITGVYTFDQKNSEFHFRPGPIMAHLVLVDEINRASPKTQSALLECMEEHQVTVDGVTHPTPDPFLVLATRNPIEHGGTFPLPETELDRFMLRVRLDYPSPEEEVAILEHQVPLHPIHTLGQVAGREEVLQAQEAVREVYADRLVVDYVVAIVHATRSLPSIFLGASPRGSMALLTLGQARALVEGRDFVLPDDIKAVASAALGHRLILTADGRTGTSEEQVIGQILESVPVTRRSDAERFPFPRVRPQRG